MVRTSTVLAAALTVAGFALSGTAYADSTSMSCLQPATRNLMARIESVFGPMQIISTCRPGATVRDTGRPSRHRFGLAVDFLAGSRKGAVVRWLIANHGGGGTMTYSDSQHIHVDIGPHWVHLAGERTYAFVKHRRHRAAS